MTRYSREILGYAVPLFFFYGLFMSMGLGGVGWSPVFLLLGLAVALGVIMRESIWGDVQSVVIRVVLSCAFGFAVGWAMFRGLLWAVNPAALFETGTR